MEKVDAFCYLGKNVNIKIDRKLGSRHPKHGFMYMLNYGFVPNTVSGDNEELDAYLIDEFEPVDEAVGKVIAVIHRINDDDDKLVVSKNGKNYSDDAIRALTEFQEKYFESEIIRVKKEVVDSDIVIKEYVDKYLEDIKDLLVELEEYIVSVDEDNLDRLHNDYRDKMALIDLELINKNNGKCYIALDNDKVVGLIMGIISKYDEYDYLDYKCPKKGEVIELVVSSKARHNGIGQQLINAMEDYFIFQECEYVLVDVFAYNDTAIKFYSKNGYHPRMITNIKKIR
mgnify:FL=1